jgi:hypothetical protein
MIYLEITQLLILVNEIYVAWKLLFFLSCLFFYAEFKYVIRISPSPTVFFVTEFLYWNFSEFNFLLCYHYVLNMDEALYYILNIVWSRKLNHNGDSRHVSSITDSHNVQSQTCTVTLEHETYRKFSSRNTALLMIWHCVVCLELTFICQRQNFTPPIKKCYEFCFEFKVGDLDKSWTPHICCVTCMALLTGWVNCSRQMPFAVLKVWKELKNHSSDCYSCLTNMTEITYKSRRTVNCPDLPSAMRPVPQRKE